MRHHFKPLYRSTPDAWEREIRPRLDLVAQQNPGWGLWITLLETTLGEVSQFVWPAVGLQLRPHRAVDAPLLAGATISLEPRTVHHWVQQLVKHPQRDTGGRPVTRATLQRVDALAFFEAALCLDEPRLGEVANRIGIDPAALGAVAYLAAIPLLQACGQFFSGQLPGPWPYGYCPLCGVWAALAELCGLERAQRLRCARCGTGWGTTWLRCPYCGENDHHRLGFLVLEGSSETRKVATCLSCKGYLKTLTTLQASPGYTIPLDDLATIDLDLAAMERGYRRQPQLGYRLHARVGERRSRWHAFFGWRA